MNKKNNFLKSAAILGIAGIIVKILGAIYRIPLSNIIKSEGIGYYQTAYPFYTLLLTVSTAGFPIAIAKLVSEKRAIGDYKGAHKVFKVALMGLFLGGLLTSLFLFFRAEAIVTDIGNKNAYFALIALVPALFFVPIMSSFRGFFQGSQSMTPTALSQIIEQLFRVASGLGLTYLLLDKGIPMAAGGASFGGSVGAMAGTITIIAIYFYKRKEIINEIKGSIYTEDHKTTKIINNLLIIAIPITIGASIVPIMDYIDLKLVLKRLQLIGFSESRANDLFGNKGMAQTLVNLPQVFSVAISMSLVPVIAGANARRRKDEIKTIISSGIRMTLLIGLPAAFGLFVLAGPIIKLLYYNNTIENIINIGNILTILSIGVIFLTLVQALSAILQGLGKPIISVINLAVGAIAKIILTYILTGIDTVNIYGAAISTVTAFAIAAVLDLISVIKYSKVKLSTRDIFIRPFISALGMGIITWFTFIISINIVGEKLATIISILAGGLSYVVFLLITGAITAEDLSLLPKGDRINKRLSKYRKIK